MRVYFIPHFVKFLNSKLVASRLINLTIRYYSTHIDSEMIIRGLINSGINTNTLKKTMLATGRLERYNSPNL